MGKFILRRIFQGFLVVLGVTLVVFVATRLVGDPAKVMLPLSATDQQRAAFEQKFGLDKPLAEQFVTFVEGLATLDFGESMWQRRPALDVVAGRLPKTLQLIAVGLGLALVLALPLGALAAIRPGGFADRLTVFGGLFGLSLPQFWLGLLLIMVFAVTFRLLPTSGYGSWAHFILPAVTLAIPATARLMMLVRSSVIDELNQQYVRTARAKGLSFRQVLFGHALRNAMVPFITLAGWELISALAGYTVVVETVFAWPGLGLTAMQAIKHSDLFLLQAIVFTVAICIVVVNIVLDVAYKLIDPRIKLA
ncbi:ABC transporter permease [Kaistia algarum]|uniref:ABC transporter permease n=1 Tax=Kaistia algarum TaxID=2083279 RepID=UPI000CE7ED9F|nr:ABC transporter permease [Kaistia algarum]MCX5511891.1 ABC transporter permease [Kaistia algarum]PPE80027.1 ABC transporter permease [Kaistia algarum]